MKKRCFILAIIIFGLSISPFPAAGQAIFNTQIFADSQPEAGKWYVAPNGNDDRVCSNPATPCATINAAIGMAAAGDTVYVQSGSYFTGSSGQQVILINKNITISGGWNSAFSLQDGISRIDGENVRPCLLANETLIAFLSHLILENGNGLSAGGIINYANLYIEDSIIRKNYPRGIDNHSGGNITLVDSRVERNGIASDGGGISNNGALTLLRSAVMNNSADWGGGGIVNRDNLLLINSTIADNTAHHGGAIWAMFGGIRVYNSTITHNFATFQTGGVYIEPGEPVYLQNSILAENAESTPTSPNCSGSPTSGGYNLVDDISGCNYVPFIGDLLDQPPAITRYNTFYALLPSSPAIDAANPTGCVDDQNQPILVDQRGSPRPKDGDNDGSVVCDIGSYEYDPARVHRLNFLPLTANPCPVLYEDDFSNPASGWPAVDNPDLFLGYASGEYRILLRNPNWYALVRPGFRADNYTISVDVRNITGVMGSYGIAFGISSDWSSLYTLELYPDGWFGLYRYDPYGYVILAEAFSPYILQGTASNHISIQNGANQITAYANGKQLASVYDPTYSGKLYLGLINIAYNDPNVDIRYDNYRVQPSACGEVSVNLKNPGEWRPEWFSNPLASRIEQAQLDKHQP